MSNSRTLIPSPARSQGAPRTPRRYVTPRKTRSVCSPARSTASGRLSTLIQEHREQDKSSFMLSPIVRRSLLPDDTDIDVPGRKSWWKNLNDQSRDVMEVLKENIIEPHNIMDELNIEVLSQEAKKRYTSDLPDSSDCESIHSIVIPHKRLFDQKENRPQKHFDDFGNSRTLVFESNADHEKPTTTRTKELFQSKPTAKPAFPAALLDVSANTTVGNKTLAPAVKPSTGLRNMLGTQQATKRKNMFAKFIESTTDYSSEEEIVDVSKVQRKFFDLPKPGPQRRISARSSSSKLRDQSPTSNDMADSFADWDHLPSSTMVDNQLEAALTGGNKAKRSRLSKLSEASSPLTSNSSKSGNKSKHCNRSLTNKSQIKNKSLEKNFNIPLNTTLALKLKENRDMNNIETNKNIQNTENKVEKPIVISLKNNDHKSLLNEEEAVPENIEMDIDEQQTEEQEFRETAEKNKNSIKPTLNKSLDKSSKKNDSHAISSKNNVIDLAMEKLDEIINQDVDTDVLIPKDKSINKQVEENLECQYDNVSEILNKENDSQLNNPNIKEVNNFSQKDKKFKEEHTTKALNKISKSQIQNESVNSNDAKAQNHNIDAMPNAMVINEYLSENKELTNEIEQNKIQKSREECNDSQEIEEETEAEKNESKEKITFEENITEEQNESVDNQGIENENDDQETEKNESETEEQENDENESEVEEQEVDENESETGEQAIDENYSETEEQGVEDSEREILEQIIDENESETKVQDDNESQIEEEKVDENEVGNDDQDSEDNQEVASEVDEQKTTSDASNQSIEAIVDSEPENDQDSDQEQVNETIQESENEEVNESEPESDNEKEVVNESDNEQINESERETEAEQVNESDQEIENDQNDEDTLTPDVSHDTTGRNRKKPDNVSMEAVLFRPTKELEHSIVGRARNTSVKKSKSLINPHIEPEKIQENNSKGRLSLSEGRNSSAEGSGWDSHRTTRKTLRQTFGKDFTPRKSLRALVMEKSAKRHTLAKGSKDITTGNIPLANSTELGEASMGHNYEMQEESVESEHEVSIRTRKATLEEYLKKIKRENDEKRAKMEEVVKKYLEQAPKEHTFKVPARPTFQRRIQAKGQGEAKVSTNKKLKLSMPLEDLPADVQEDLKYKPPKRFTPRNAAWLTKRFYKYVETKLEPKYDYKARVRAEKFAQTLYNFVQANRRRNIALQDHVEELKHEMARLKIVKTHFEFYNFFWDFMPREVRLKVIPDLNNKIPQPRNGIFADILVSDC